MSCGSTVLTLTSYAMVFSFAQDARTLAMNLKTETYAAQSVRWPQTGRVILAHYDDESIVVYQAYKPEIADYAVAHGRLGGPHFSMNRMSWIKPNFLWM